MVIPMSNDEIGRMAGSFNQLVVYINTTAEHVRTLSVGDLSGKVEVRSIKPCFSPREIRLAYLPGAAFPAEAIAASMANLPKL